MKRLVGGLVAAALLGLIPFAIAQEPGKEAPKPTEGKTVGLEAKPGAAFFEKFDLNKNGSVTWEEYQKVRSGFAHFDADADGVITQADFAKIVERNQARMQEAMQRRMMEGMRGGRGRGMRGGGARRGPPPWAGGEPPVGPGGMQPGGAGGFGPQGRGPRGPMGPGDACPWCDRPLGGGQEGKGPGRGGRGMGWGFGAGGPPDEPPMPPR